MKKSTIILIAIVYIASIVVISVFGLKAKIFGEVIPVTAIECLNKTDRDAFVEKLDDITTINLQYKGPGSIENPNEGTMLQLVYRVLPDNATNKKVKFEYNESLTRLQFVKDDKGNDLGLILFSGTGIFHVQIMATDGSQKVADVYINVYP